MLDSNTKHNFLIYIILLSINLSLEINVTNILLLTISFFYTFINTKISFIFLFLWVILLIKKSQNKETFQQNTDKETDDLKNIPVKPNLYFINKLKSIVIGEKNGIKIVSKLNELDKKKLLKEEQEAQEEKEEKGEQEEEQGTKDTFFNEILDKNKSLFSRFEKYNIEIYRNKKQINERYKTIIDKCNIGNTIDKKYLLHLFSFNTIIDTKSLNSKEPTVWLLNTYNNIIKNTILINDYNFIKHNVYNKMIRLIEDVELDYNKKKEQQLSNVSTSESRIVNFNNVNDETKKREFKTIERLNKENSVDDKPNYKKEKNYIKLLNTVSLQFSITMLNIIEDILDLFKKKINFSSASESYVYYIKEIFYILTDDGRLFYLGLFFLVISICLLFIEIT